MSPSPPEATASSSRLRQPRELLQEVGRDLVEACPEDWFRVDLRASVAATTSWLALTVLMPDLSSAVVDPPLSVGRALRELREVMYVEGRGTWFSLRFTMDPPAGYHVVYNHDFDPKWSPDLSAPEWALDLERFPRADEHIPDWLRAKLPTDAEMTPGY